jgi:molecular chaperone DnaK
MRREADAHSEEDKRQRTLIEKRNQADALVYNVERTLKEHGAKIGAADRTKIEDAVKEVREALKGDDAARIEKAGEALTQASYAIAQMLYQQKGQGPEPGAEPGPDAGRPGDRNGPEPRGPKGKGDDVIDADYEVKG